MPTRLIPRSLVAIVGAVLFLTFTLTLTTALAQPIEPQSSSTNRIICFVADFAATCVDRPALSASGTLTDQVRSLVEALLLGPTTDERAKGIQSALPPDARLAEVHVIDQRVGIDLNLAPDFLKSLTPEQVEAIVQQVRTTLTPFNFQRIDVNARDTAGIMQPLSAFLPAIEIPRKEPPPGAARPPSPAKAVEGVGGLSGKTVFISAGHGWYWHTTLGYYKTQRPVYPVSPYPSGEGIIEDFNNAEVVNQYLLKYLANSGADAWTTRERDANTNMLIVDDASADFAMQGAPGAWSVTTTAGYEGGYHYAPTNATATATATWTFTPTAARVYAVYVRFPSSSLPRVSDAHLYVDHAGGTTPITLTQTRDTNNWRYIGDFPFYAGQTARLRITNQSTMVNVVVLADAIRIGGGLGDTSVAGAPISFKPRWEEQARQYAKWVGMSDVDNLNDVIVRPIYSEWEREAGEDAVYISWHTNGYNGYNTSARGTESYIHSYEATPNSDILQNFVHSALLSEIRTGWDAAWPDRGKKSLDLGELRLLDTMPGVLLENGYHDNPTDVESMKDARFMQLSARAVYHGLVKYWHSIDPSVPLVYLPEPPTHLIVRNSGAGQVTLTWQPGPTDGDGPLGDAATSYRVYTSADGFGWDNGTAVNGTAYIINDLSLNQLIFVKVTGLNAGGESFATPVLAARVAAQGLAPILIVSGFDRIDRLGAIQQNDPNEGWSRRVFVDRINRQDYIIQHAEAITRPFDSAQHSAVSDAAIALGNYALVDWQAGEEQTPFVPLTANDQAYLSNYLTHGGALFISGSELGFELRNTAFYGNVLRAGYSADDANTYVVNSVSGGIFDSLGTLTFDDGTHGIYSADYADVFTPINGATSALVYNNGGSAALQYANGCTRLVYAAVPFETLYPAATRQAVMARILDYLDECLLPEVDTTIQSPVDNALLNAVPSFNGAASSSTTGVQVSIKRVSDQTFYNGTSFISGPEAWLAATGTTAWSYSLPALDDGAYALRARAITGDPITDTSPAAITVTLDTIAPVTPIVITPTGGISMVAVSPAFVWTGETIPTGRWDVEVDGTLHQVFELAAPPDVTLPATTTLTVTWPITLGEHQWRVRATDGAGNPSSWSEIASFNSTALQVYLPLISLNFKDETPPPTSTCSDIAVNGGFETGDFTGWSRPSTNPLATIASNIVHTGQSAARVGKADGGSTVTGFSSIQQDFTIPANALTATVSFERYRYSNDLDDLHYVAVMSGGAVADYLVYEHVNDPQWRTATFDLMPYAGQSIGLRFSVWNKTAASVTGVIVDDVKINVCVP